MQDNVLAVRLNPRTYLAGIASDFSNPVYAPCECGLLNRRAIHMTLASAYGSFANVPKKMPAIDFALLN
jgi:hypothetical protein